MKKRSGYVFKNVITKKGSKIGATKENSRLFFKLGVISLLVNLVAISIIFFLKNRLPPELPLFYGLPEGKDQLTQTLGLAIAPGVSFLITGTNLFLYYLIKNDFLKKTLIISSLVVSFFTTVTLVKIIFLVF